MIPIFGSHLALSITIFPLTVKILRRMNTAKGLLRVMILAGFNFYPCTSSTLITETFHNFGKMCPFRSTPAENCSSSLGTKHKFQETENYREKLPFNPVEELSKERQSRRAADTKGLFTSRLKRQVTPVSLGTNIARFGLQKTDIFKTDKSLEALLKGFVEDHMEGCDLIVIFDNVFSGSRALESLSVFPVIKQVLQPVSLEDWTEMIEWETKNCVGTFLLLSEPDPLISFGNINRFHWSYKAKVIIVGLSLSNLEVFLKTAKGSKTEHIIGVVEDLSNNHFSIYMNLLFWGEGLEQMTEWKSGNFTKNAVLFPDKISNLKQANVTVCTFELRPLTYYERFENGTIKKRYGRDYSLLETLRQVFNYTLVIIDLPHVAFGYRLPNGSFTGIPGILARDEAQMAIPSLMIIGVEDKHLVQDYSRPFDEDKGCFLIRREAPLPPWQAPLLPFQLNTWIAFIVGLFLSGPIFYAIVMANSNVAKEHDQYKSLASVSLIAIATHFDHPLVILPKQLSSQVFLVFLLVYNLILSTGYRSNLISFLTVARPPKQIETFKDLYESGLPVSTFPGWGSVLKESDNIYLNKFYHERYDLRYTTEEAIPDAMNGKTSVLSGISVLEGLRLLLRTKNGKPVARLLKDCILPASIGTGFQWHTPLKPKFNKVIARLFESGLTNEWFIEARKDYRKFAEKEGKVTYYEDLWHDSQDELIPLTLAHTQGIFIIIALGYFFAAIAFAAEATSK